MPLSEIEGYVELDIRSPINFELTKWMRSLLVSCNNYVTVIDRPRQK